MITQLAKTFSSASVNRSVIIFTRSHSWTLFSDTYRFHILTLWFCGVSFYIIHRLTQVVSSLEVFWVKFCTHFWSLLCGLRAPFMASSSIWTPYIWRRVSWHNGALHIAVFLTHLFIFICWDAFLISVNKYKYINCRWATLQLPFWIS
jgi:hypothetical protein